jgi:L-iditol 2-dehydrogenase
MTSLPAGFRAVYLVGRRRLEVREAPLPRPGTGEILLRIGAATTCGTDLKVWQRGGHPRMLTVPCPFGHEMAGDVAAVGDAVNTVGEGARVVVANSASCGECTACRAGHENLCRDLVYLNGAFGEYLLIPERFVLRSTYGIAPGLPLELATLAEPLACVLHGLEVCALDGREGVLVLGAGPVGLMFVAVLAARRRRVVLADLIPRRLEVGRALGAAETILLSGGEGDPELLRGGFAGTGPELVVEATGHPPAWEAAIGAVVPGGEVLLFGGCLPGTTASCDTHRLHYSELTIRGAYHHRPATFRQAVRSLEEGLDLGPIVDHQRPLDEVGDALAAMERREILKAVIRP